jgi:hypothetical protein
MYRACAGVATSPIGGPARTGAATENVSPTGVNDTTLLTSNFAGVADCGPVTEETVQHGAVMQLAPAGAENDGACPDALMEGMAATFDMPCIGAPLWGRQQSAEELPSAHIF